jgi:hypothetical protein
MEVLLFDESEDSVAEQVADKLDVTLRLAWPHSLKKFISRRGLQTEAIIRTSPP